MVTVLVAATVGASAAAAARPGFISFDGFAGAVPGCSSTRREISDQDVDAALVDAVAAADGPGRLGADVAAGPGAPGMTVAAAAAGLARFEAFMGGLAGAGPDSCRALVASIQEVVAVADAAAAGAAVLATAGLRATGAVEAVEAGDGAWVAERGLS